jgi:hypothetical protein
VPLLETTLRDYQPMPQRCHNNVRGCDGH